MLAPLILLAVSSLALIATALWPDWSGFLMITLPSMLASALLLLRSLIQRKPTPNRGTKSKAPKTWAVIDGSNVMHWKGSPPSLIPVQDVLAMLDRRGFSAGVVFDANAGHKLTGRYQDDPDLARKLGLPIANVLVVPKGTPADPAILQTAADLGARIVTNDRFRDWADKHPQVATPGYLIKGGYHDGKLWLDLA